jgi:hypothetical protein
METKNTWPGGVRRAMHQHEHESYNASHYPGTLQLCSKCEQPTGRCEEDAMWDEEGNPLCETCYAPNVQICETRQMIENAVSDLEPTEPQPATMEERTT